MSRPGPETECPDVVVHQVTCYPATLFASKSPATPPRSWVPSLHSSILSASAQAVTPWSCWALSLSALVKRGVCRPVSCRYPFERLPVTTEDGYIITLERIPRFVGARVCLSAAVTLPDLMLPSLEPAPPGIPHVAQASQPGAAKSRWPCGGLWRDAYSPITCIWDMVAFGTGGLSSGRGLPAFPRVSPKDALRPLCLQHAVLYPSLLTLSALYTTLSLPHNVFHPMLSSARRCLLCHGVFCPTAFSATVLSAPPLCVAGGSRERHSTCSTVSSTAPWGEQAATPTLQRGCCMCQPARCCCICDLQIWNC